MSPRFRSPTSDEPLGVLLLPTRLEDFDRAEHARELLQIPRVIALEASSHRTPRLLRNSAPIRQAKRLRLPGIPQLLVLYEPEQYRLARALLARYDGSELWYVRPGDPGPADSDLVELDRLAVERATEARLLAPDRRSAEGPGPLRLRLQELGIISSRPFVPGARIASR